MSASPTITWSSKLTFIFAATGSAVGLGNIWKFPYMTGEYGGGAFVLIYLACILLLGLPIMMAEIAIGRSAKANPIDAIEHHAARNGLSKNWFLLPAMGLCAGIMILMFYSVVAGWTLDYIVASLSGSYMGVPAEAISGHFGELTSNFGLQLIYLTIFVVLTGLLVVGGAKAIGKAVEVMMPALFIILLILLGYAFFAGDVARGMEFMWKVDFSKITMDVVLAAMGQAFFTLSLGMGSIMAYGAYMGKDVNIGKTALTIGLVDTLVALIAGMMIFPLVFAHGLEPSAGPGLVFVTLPNAFSQMFGGQFIGLMFFILLTLAALSSSISLIEPSAAWFERKGVKRIVSVTGLCAIAWIGAAASAASGDVFNFLDVATANYMLPLGGLLAAVLIGWRMHRNETEEALALKSTFWFQAWYLAIRFIAPVCVGLVMLNGLGLL